MVDSGLDRKWDELSKILQNDPHVRDADGRQHKMILFTEHRDTLNYLERRIGGVLGTPESITTIHGSVHRDERRKRQEMFRSDPEVRILLATDAAGEGVNLQNANLMVNYDLPWNPNRLEQRFGRLHRIGQQQVCHLWNLVAKETREGEVYHRLLTKLENINDAFKGRVFDILGEVFEERSLKDLLLDAIRYNDQPERHAARLKCIDNALDVTHIKDLLERNALAQETMSAERLFAVKEQMEIAEARRLQPYFVRSFFVKAFEGLNGAMYPRESGRFEITHVPALIRERDRQITGRNRRELAPVLKRYERVCFTKEAVRPLDRPNAAFAQMIHPGHPLMLAVSDLILEQHSNLMRQGAILVDPADDGTKASLLFLITHEIKSGDSSVLSKRLQFVHVTPDGKANFAGWAPHLDLEPYEPQKIQVASLQARRASEGFIHANASTTKQPNDETTRLRVGLVNSELENLLNQPWIRADQEQRALALAAVRLAEESRGCRVVDVSAQKCGWDITSYPPRATLSALGRGAGGEVSPQPVSRHLEVKGRIHGATFITVTRNEILYALNQADKFVLAIVLVGEDEIIDGPHYVRNPFTKEPDWSESSSNHDLAKLLSIATRE